MIFEKAKELGKMIVETAEYKAMKETKEKFMSDDAAIAALDSYKELQIEIQGKMMNQELSEEEFKVEIEKLQKMGESLKENEIVYSLLEAENNFNTMMNEVLAVLKAEIDSEDAEEDGCGCGHNHGHSHGHGGCQGGCC